MKARAIEGLEPGTEFGEAVRQVVALHDMRIAAKRLRYVLELAEPCYGKASAARAKRARALQDLLGDIHDCDVLLPLAAEEPRLAEAIRARRDELFTRFREMWATMEEHEWELPR